MISVFFFQLFHKLFLLLTDIVKELNATQGIVPNQEKHPTDLPFIIHWPTELRFYVPLNTKIGHFEDVLPSQSLA